MSVPREIPTMKCEMKHNLSNDSKKCEETAEHTLILHSNVFSNLIEIGGAVIHICAEHKALIEKEDPHRKQYKEINPIITEEEEQEQEIDLDIDTQLAQQERQYNEDADQQEEAREDTV